MAWLDWLVLAVYALLILCLGWLASRGQRTGESHLRAGRNLPAWAVVFSVLATEISAATYIGVPETAYRGNWNYMQTSVGALLGKWLLATFFIRLYWRLNLPTVYGLLGQRIGPTTQTATAWAFLVGRLIASGVRLFIAALAFSTVTGLPIGLAIAFMALTSTAYTLIGGLRAVVWTDVAQGAIFVLGALAAIVVALARVETPLQETVAQAWEHGKLQFITLQDDGKGWLASLRPFPVAVLGGLCLTLATHGTDQENVQHLLNTRSEKSSGRSVMASGFFTFPVVATFLFVGTSLWLYYRQVTPQGYGISSNEEIQRIFPNFIMHELPTGIRGLVFAGLFAAAISSLGATLNATTAAFLADIRGQRAEGARGLVTARVTIGVFGLLLAGIGLFFAWYARDHATGLVHLALGAMTILYGAILGVFLVALFLRTRGSDWSVVAGLVTGVACGAFLFFHVKILGLEAEVLVWPFYLPISAGLTMLVSCLGRREAALVR